MLLRSSRSLVALLAVPLFVACGYGDHRHSDGYYANNPPAVDVQQATIDADRTIHVERDKAGVYVEYQSGGTYSVTTVCDNSCTWDILITTLDDASVQSATPVGLEGDDSLSLYSGNQVRLVAYTGQDLDGFTFQTDPGAAIELDALLDDGAANRFLFWAGDGALRSGAPSNPIDLVPSAD